MEVMHEPGLGGPSMPTYAQRMPVDDVAKPKRKAMFLSPQALSDLAELSATRRTEREAVEEALALLVERERQNTGLDEFIAWAKNEWGEATPEEEERAAKILNELT